MALSHTIPPGSAALLLMPLMYLLGGCAPKNEPPPTEKTTPPVVAVKADYIHNANVENTIEVTGRMQVLRQEKIYAPIAGTVLRFALVEGMNVRAGGLLAMIRSKESQAQINGANVLLANASTPEQRAEAERMLQLATSTDNSASVHAPIGGIVATRSVNQGELVAEGAEMLTIIDPSTLAFVADIPIASLASVRIGAHCRVKIQTFPDREFDAVVAALSPQSDPQSQTVQARLNFTGIPPSLLAMLKTDMPGTASIIIGYHSNALVIPKSALLRDDATGAYTIATVGPDSLAHVVEVQVGIMRDSIVEITGDGLSNAVRVITEGAYALPDSTKVTVTGK